MTAESSRQLPEAYTGPIASLDASPVKQRAAEIFELSVSTGVLTPDMVEFITEAASPSRPETLALSLLNRLTALEAKRQLDDAQGDVEAVLWGRMPGKYDTHIRRYSRGDGTTRGLSSPDFVYATSPETLDATLEVKNQYLEVVYGAFNPDSSDNGDYTGDVPALYPLIEPSFGGLDLTRPQQTVSDLARRFVLESAIAQVVGDSEAASSSVIDIRLDRLFDRFYHTAWGDLQEQITGVGKTAVPDGKTVNADRLQTLGDFVAEDVDVFLGKAWADIEDFIRISSTNLPRAIGVFRSINRSVFADQEKVG